MEDTYDCNFRKHAVMVLQVDLSDCDELGDAIFRCLSDGRRGLPGYAVDGGNPSLRCRPFACLSNRKWGATPNLACPSVL